MQLYPPYVESVRYEEKQLYTVINTASVKLTSELNGCAFQCFNSKTGI